MKDRKFFNKVKELLTKSKVVKLVIFIVGFLVSWNFLVVPTTEDQFKLCEQIAVDVRKNMPVSITSGDFFVQVTEDFTAKVNITNSIITVSPSRIGSFDCVVVILEDLNSVPERKRETPTVVAVNTMVGILFIICISEGY